MALLATLLTAAGASVAKTLLKKYLASTEAGQIVPVRRAPCSRTLPRLAARLRRWPWRWRPPRTAEPTLRCSPSAPSPACVNGPSSPGWPSPLREERRSSYGLFRPGTRLRTPTCQRRAPPPWETPHPPLPWPPAQTRQPCPRTRLSSQGRGKPCLTGRAAAPCPGRCPSTEPAGWSPPRSPPRSACRAAPRTSRASATSPPSRLPKSLYPPRAPRKRAERDRGGAYIPASVDCCSPGVPASMNCCSTCSARTRTLATRSPSKERSESSALIHAGPGLMNNGKRISAPYQ